MLKTGIISSYDAEKKRVRIELDKPKTNRVVTLELVMLRQTCRGIVCDCPCEHTCIECPGVPIVGRRAACIMFADGKGKGLYLGMIEE